MSPYWGESFGNPHSNDHVIGWQANTAVRNAAASIAALIGVDVDEIIITSGATEANNLALLGLASIRFSFGRFTTDDEIERSAQLVLEILDSLSSDPVKKPA